jgi:hypothetical protein
MTSVFSRARMLAAGLATLLPSLAFAALPDAPHEDIHFVAEHLAEAAQDTRYFALAWPAEPLAPAVWTGGVAVGLAEARTDFLGVQGELFSAHAFHAFSHRNGLALQGFSDSFDIGGTSGEQVLRASFAAAVPLDLPERIAVTNPRGSVRHYGVGAAWLRELSAEPGHGWCLVVGGLLERLELDGFQLDYRLLGGRDVGSRGVLDHSGSATFATPYAGLLRRMPLGRAFLLTPHFAAGVPLPAADFHGRLTGPGFERSSRDAGGSPARIGDGFVELGAGLLHRASGFEVNVGGALTYPLFEKTTHAGVDRSYLVLMSWSRPRHRSAG